MGSNTNTKQLDLKKIIIKNANCADGGIYLVPSKWYLLLLMLILFTVDFLVMYAGIEGMMYGAVITCIAFALVHVTSVSRVTRNVRKYAAKLQEYIEQKEALVQELEEVLKQDLYKENEKLYDQTVKELEAREKMVKLKVRKIIAEYLADPDLASRLFCENQEINSQ